MNSEIIQIALRVIDVLEDLQIPYHVGGSFASSLHGVPRQTRDLDLVIDLPPARIPLFASRFQDEFYLDTEAIRRAVQRHSHFNLIHLTTGFKIDLFPRGTEAFDRSEFGRSRLQRLTDDPPRDVIVKSHSGTALAERYRTASGTTSWGSCKLRGNVWTLIISTIGPESWRSATFSEELSK